MDMFQSLMAQGPQSSTIVEFKAGKMITEGKLVKPDPRKGTILVKSGEFLQLEWRPRGSDPSFSEDKYILFPNEAVWKRVRSAKTGRVYALKFITADHLKFFWIQEPHETADAEIAEKINNALRGEEQEGGGLTQNHIMEMIANSETTTGQEGNDGTETNDVVNLDMLNAALGATNPGTPRPESEENDSHMEEGKKDDQDGEDKK